MAGEWEAAGNIINHETRALERGGADVIVLATNTMHKLADRMMEGVGVPLIHIADATARAIKVKRLQRTGLVATAFTMEQDFYTGRLGSAGLSPRTPGESGRSETHRIIYEELCKDFTSTESEQTYVNTAERPVEAGARPINQECRPASGS